MGTIFLVRVAKGQRANVTYVGNIIGRAKRAPHWGVQSRFHMDDICLSCTKMRRRNYVRACSKSVLGD